MMEQQGKSMNRNTANPFNLAAAALMLLGTTILAHAGQFAGTSTNYAISRSISRIAPVDDSENGRKAIVTKTYVYTTRLKDDQITLEIRDGVATLTGTVAEESHKALAREALMNLPGANRVDNRLVTKANAAAGKIDKTNGEKAKKEAVVESREPAKTIASDKRDDASITAQIESRSDRPASTGIVENAAAKPAAKLVADMQGSTDTKNHMIVEESMTK